MSCISAQFCCILIDHNLLIWAIGCSWLCNRIQHTWKISPYLKPRLVSGDRKLLEIKSKKKYDYFSICLEFNAYLSGRCCCWLCRPDSMEWMALNQIGSILGFVFPPSGIWCQFSEGFGPICGWNVYHHSVNLSGQLCPEKQQIQ